MIKEYSLEQFNSGRKYQNFHISALDGQQAARFATPNMSSFYQIVIIRQGSGSYSIDFEKHTIQSPAICFIFPHQVCRFDLSQDIAGDVIMFDETIFCSEILANELKEYNVDLQKKINFVDFTAKQNLFSEIENVKGFIQNIEEPFNNLRKIQIKFLTKIIIFKVIDASSSDEFSGLKSKDLETYIAFRESVDKEFTHNRKVEAYCDQLGVSAKRLNLLCKQYSNKNALDIIHERLTLEIKKIFISEDTPLKEVAFNLGFDSQSALNKYIASKFDTTPSLLKESLQRNYGE